MLSGLAGLDRTHYSKIERGLRSPTIDTLFKVSHALDMEPHEIVAAIEQALSGEVATAMHNKKRAPDRLSGAPEISTEINIHAVGARQRGSQK